MQKRDVKFYKVNVQDRKSRATLICVTYKIGFSSENIGAEFYQLVSSFDDSELKYPTGAHTFTFKEELRFFSTAPGIAPNNREQLNGWIENKMNEAYGSGCKVSIGEIKSDTEV